MSIPFATQNMIYLVYHNIAWRRQIFYEQRAQRTDNAIILRKQGGGEIHRKTLKFRPELVFYTKNTSCMMMVRMDCLRHKILTIMSRTA